LAFATNRRRIILLALLLLFAGGGYLYRQHHRYKHFAVHEPGRVYRVAWVEADVMGELVRTHGIKAVLNLCRPDEMGATRAAEERQAVEAAGAKLLEFSLPETSDPHDPRLDPHIAAIQDPANYPMLIHCQHGVNRTARSIAMYEVLVKHRDGEAAVQQMPKFSRQYNPLEFEFARNFTTAFLTVPVMAAEPSSASRQ
jgi:predicted protein tyrosine phosphatase